MANKGLPQIQAEAQALVAKIQASGVSVADRPSIAAAATSMLSLLNDLQPHVNDASSAFGNQEANVAQISKLRNTLNKIVATYSS